MATLVCPCGHEQPTGNLPGDHGRRPEQTCSRCGAVWFTPCSADCEPDASPLPKSGPLATEEQEAVQAGSAALEHVRRTGEPPPGYEVLLDDTTPGPTTPEGRALARALREGVDEPTAALAWSGPEYHAKGNPPPAVLNAVREAYPAMVRVHPVTRVVERVIPPVTSEYEEPTVPEDDVSGEQGWFTDGGDDSDPTDDALLRELGAHVREVEALEPMAPDRREALLDLVIAPPLEPLDPEETERRVDAVLAGRASGAGT